MLNAQRIIKFGRKDKILEISDHLQVNNFYNETGYASSVVEGKFSRINIVLVDTKEGKKGKAKIGKYNLTIENVRKILEAIDYKPDPNKYKEDALEYNKKYYQKNNDFLGGFKMNSYVKDDQGYSPTSFIKLTYEEAMRSDSKWKITIDNGVAIAEDKGNLIAPKSGSYKKTNSVSFNLTQLELEEMIQTVVEHIKLWRQYAFPKMMEYRNLFEERCKKNDYKEETMKTWNKDPHLEVKPAGNKQITNNKPAGQKPNENKPGEIVNENKQSDNKQINNQQGTKDNNCICSNCGSKVNDAIKKYSLERYNKVLCMKCQSKAANKKVAV